MCGIAGVLGYHKAELKKMLLRIQHRGPDHEGIAEISETKCWLGHVRLSIIDLDSRSNQPFFSPCGRYTLVFNGEIYNYKSLKSELEAEGVVFQTSSDTEVLLFWLIRYGVSGLTKLEGMFAFGLADAYDKSLLLVRDPIGEKPLYYTKTSGRSSKYFAFASEIKSLLVLSDVDRALDQTALLDYIRFLYTAPPNTLYKGINELAPGNYLEIDLSSDNQISEPRVYYSIEKNIQFLDDISSKQLSNLFQDHFNRSVQLRMISDVNIGLFLSAGMDSNAILAAAQTSQRCKDLHTYTLEYSTLDDESNIVRKITSRLNLPNVTIPFKSMDFFSSVHRVIDLFDQPFGNATSIVSDMIAAEAAKSCKVCLVGDGGDEIALGYPRYHALTLFSKLNLLPLGVRSLLARSTSWIPESGRLAIPIRRGKQFLATLNHPIAESFIDWSTYVNSANLTSATGISDCHTPFYHDLLSTFERFSKDPIQAAAIVDMKSFVPFNLMQNADRTSMSHSLELRSPFLAVPLINSIMGVPSHLKKGKGTKPLIRNSMGEKMPFEVLNQPKRPFNPPIREMLRANGGALESYLLSSDARIKSILDDVFLKQEVMAFKNGERDNSTFLWGLVTMENWLQRKDSLSK